ncbi:MAG TPA: zf-HC2 domain-containing protein [Blastocatellia bacterium]|nr:zf-HC2 domain-containing protein [Blastocatellia bacterium]
MNCRRIEKLLPLYVEGDARADEADAVTLHLNTCRECNRLASEYRESQNLLRSAPMIELEDDELNWLKRSVLGEITLHDVRASFFNRMIERLSARRMVAAAALAIVIASLTFYFFRARTAAPTSDGSESVAGAAEANRQPSAQPEDAKPAPRADFTPATDPAAGRRAMIKAHNRSSRTTRQTLVAKEQSPVLNVKEAQPDVVSNSQEMLRIEIQTSDPNIRIIWFAPKEVDSRPLNPETERGQEALWF